METGGEPAGPAWLSAEEQRAWRLLAAVLLQLPTALDRQLRRDHDLSHVEYWILALLSEATGHRLRLSHLADQASTSISRLSHTVTRLERRGLVERRPCPDDARATLAVLTPAGAGVVARAAPGHVAAVRELVFGGSPGQQVAALERVCRGIVERLGTGPVGAGAGQGSAEHQ